ncbi:unnamed protein product [Dicrocoelium dendriticum]|nr:unnamed protein product [Dicrocoelium dendriticum]
MRLSATNVLCTAPLHVYIAFLYLGFNFLSPCDVRCAL